MIQHTGAAFCRPLRVLLVADSLDVGGAEQHVVSLAVALAQKGYHVTLACSVEGSLASFPRQGNVLVQPLLHTLVKRQFSLGFAWQLSQLVRRGSFDLVHAHMYTSAFASACALFGTSIPLVITEHSQANWRSKHAQRCSRWFYHRASHIIAVSKEIRRRLIERDNVPFDRVSVIMNATPLLAVPNTEPVLPVEIGKGLLVGMVARLQPEKGPTYFLEAAAYVLRVVQDIQFLVVGDGPMRAKLQAYAVQLGIQKHVHFLGFRLDARSLIGLLDILVVPSLSEGTPLVTLEAMTADVAVVATKVGGIPEQIRHQQEGLLVPPGNSSALGEAILHLLRHPLQRMQLGVAGRRRAQSQFLFSTMVQETEAIYHTLLDRQEQRDLDRQEHDSLFAETGGL